MDHWTHLEKIYRADFAAASAADLFEMTCRAAIFLLSREEPFSDKLRFADKAILRSRVWIILHPAFF